MSRIIQVFQHSMRSNPTSTQRHDRPCFPWIYVFILGLLCLLQAGLVEAAFPCPENCDCTFTKDADNNKWQNISCVRLGYTDVPSSKKEGADVVKLNLTGNNISMITDTSFQYFINLVDLDLSYNEITYLTANAFSSLTNLQYLSLEGNTLTLISSAIFQIENLVSLNLARNPNISFPTDDVNPPNSFTHLDISHCSISIIPANLLNSLEKLKFLDMSHNSITSIPTDTFSSNSKLEFINLEGNSFTSVDRDWFKQQNLDNLQELDISHNAITTVDKNFMRDLTNLNSLDLSNNRIRDIDKDVFKKRQNLESADLSNNYLTRLDKKLFDGCRNLKTLDVSDNDIDSLDSNTFKDVSLLGHLDLSNNQLKNIEVDIFKHVTGLDFLDLSFNQLKSIPVDVFSSFTGSIILNITGNDYTCDCEVRNYLYTLRYDTLIDLFDEDNIKCNDGSQEVVFLDWFSSDCSGNLGWYGCNSDYDCFSRNAKCNDTNYCECSPNYYDNNDIFTDGGVCKPKVGLGYPCLLEAACLPTYSECIGPVKAMVCKCKTKYYDTNRENVLGGECKSMVELGSKCTMKSMCAPDKSECVGGHCQCESTHYDSNDDEPAGTCIEKLELYEPCTATYQCAPENSECSSTENICDCANNFYDMDGEGTCQEADNSLLTSQHHRVKRANSVPQLPLQFCRKHGIQKPNACRASSFFSCFLDETDGDNKPVEFSALKTGMNLDKCKEYCFSQNQWHITLKDSYCLCGSTTGSTITGCCPYSSGSTSCSTPKSYLPASDIKLVTSGLKLNAVPQLTAGVAHRFEATTTLPSIDQIKWNFGDTESEEIVDASQSMYYHTYTHSGKFTVTVSGCVKSVSVCHEAKIPVIVQVPDVNLTMWITGYQRANVANSMTDITATFEQGYDFEYRWTRKDSNNNVIYTLACEPGWTAFRQTCLKLHANTGTFSTAANLKCAQDSATVLELNFEEEIEEIVSLLSISSTDQVYLNAERQSNGAYLWLSDNSKVFFTEDNLADASLGDKVVIDGSTKALTSADPNTKKKIVCMKDPVDCPKGGYLDSVSGNCYATKSASISWEAAKSACISLYGGRLANPRDQSTHSFLARLMTNSGISKAWIGLSDRDLEGYYTWSDDTSYDYDSPLYKPTISSLDHDCFVLLDSSTLTTEDCHSTMSYACEYSIRNERLTVHSQIAGSPNIQMTGNSNIEQVVETTVFSTSGDKEVILFPGMWFTREGNVLSWNIHTINVSSGKSYKLALQVYRPECTLPKIVVQAGCAGGSMFANCMTSRPTCSPSNVCDDTKSFCYLSNQCKSFSESCTCTSESSSASAVQACNSLYAGTQPVYKLVGQTMVTIDSAGEKYYTIPAGSISVEENDVIGIEVEKGDNVIKCEDLSTSKLQQTSLVSDHSHWLIKDDVFSSTAATTVNQTCYFQAIYTQESAQNLTQYLGYFESAGAYSLEVEILSNGFQKTLGVNLNEAIGDIRWVYPQIAEAPTVSNSLGTCYIEYGVSYNFTLSVGKGTSLEATYSFDSSAPQSFQSSCPADVIAEVPDACDTAFIWSANPFSFFRDAINSTGTHDLSVMIKNNIDSQTKMVTFRIEKRITSLTIACTSSSNNIVAVNDAADFATTVADGTGLSYSYMIEGTPVTGATGDTMTKSFIAAGNLNVSVSVSNILGSSQASLIMTVILPANFAHCQFTSSSYIAAVGVSLTMSVTCEVVLTAVVEASWYISDRPSATPLSSTETASVSTTVIWTQAIVFQSASSSVTVRVTYTDFIISGSVSTNVTVYEAVPSFTFTPSVQKALVGDTITFSAYVPTGNYGSLHYSFEFGDGSNASDQTGVVTYSYSNPRTYSVKAIVSNGPSQREEIISFEVVEAISSLSIYSDSPTKLHSLTKFNVSVAQGTGVQYRFESTIFNTTISQTEFAYVFSIKGNYTVDVTATNGLTQEKGSIMVYIMADTDIYASDLRLVGGSFSTCIESGTEHEYTASVIHFDTNGLEYVFDFGDSTTVKGQIKQKHIYVSGKSYTIQLRVSYPSSSAEVILTDSVCVQDRIASPMISVDLKIGLPQSGSMTRSATVTLTSGTSPVYSWGTNASYSGSTSASTFPLEFTATGLYFVAVNVSNEINFESASTVMVEVMYAISGLTISCSSCTEKAGHYYVQKGNMFTVLASVVSGDQVSYEWTFADGGKPLAGVSVTRSYSTIGIYNVTVEAKNDVGSETELLTVHVEEPLTNVVLSTHGTNWFPKTSESLKDLLTEFEATVSPAGMEVEFSWVFETGLVPYTSSDSIAGFNYSITGQKQCNVTAQNSINSVSNTYDFYIIEEITYVRLKLNGVDVSGTTASVALNRKYTLEISANTDVKCTYMIILRKSGRFVSMESNYTMEYTFSTTDAYTIEATVGNSKGQKPETFTVTVIEEITNPVIKVVVGAASITLGTSITFSASVQGTNPAYTWSYKLAPGSESVPSTNTGQSITLNPGMVGTYTILLSVTNDVSTVQEAEYTFEVVEAVSGVSIHSSLVPPDAVLVGTTVIFSAMAATGSDLSYVWIVDSQPETQPTVSFTFLTQKVYTVSVNISNSASSEVHTVDIYSLNRVPSFTISVTGATFEASIVTNVAATGSSLDFASSLKDVSFLTFDWTRDTVPSGNATMFTSTFMSEGSFVVALNVSNKISYSTSQITILIQDPITRLQVSNCMGTFMLNTDITLTATYGQGTDVSIIWNSEGSSSATGGSTKVQYANTGTYTVNATASNYVDRQTVSCQLIVQGVIDNLVLSKSPYSFIGYQVTFTVSGDYLESASYEWSVSTVTLSTTVPTWQYRFSTKGDYTVIVRVFNDVSSKTESMTLTVEELACMVPDIYVDGSPTRIALRARVIELGISIISSIGCTAYTTLNKWTLYSSPCSSTSKNEYILSSSIAMNTQTFRIPAAAIPYGQYCAFFENSFQNTPVTQTKEIDLTIMESKLKAIIAGGETVEIGEGNEVLLDASGSYDPDQIPGTRLSYAWTCTVQSGSSSVCSAVSTITSATETLTSLTLLNGDEYTVTVTVSSAGRQSGVATQRLIVKTSGIPVVRVSCISCAAKGHDVVSSSQSVSLQGSCLDGCDSSTTFSWSVYTGSGANANIDISKTSTTFSKENLVIKSGGLMDNTDYTFKLEATTNGKTGSSSVTLKASTVPSGRRCEVKPTNIVPLLEKVNITCENWQDSDVMSGLNYMIVVVNYDDPSQEYILYSGPSPSREFYVSPFPGSTMDRLKVYVMNDYGSGVHASTVDVTFTSPTLPPGETMTDFIVSHLQANMRSLSQQNNPAELIEYAIAVLNILNNQSRTAVDTSELGKRTAVRDLLATVIKDLQRTTTYEIQQMASALEFLTDFKEELSNLDALSSWVKSLTTELSSHVKQGLDQNDLQPDRLLTANKHIYEAYLADEFYSATSDAAVLFGDLSSYIPNTVISLSSSIKYTSDQERRQTNVEEMVKYSSKAVAIPLLAMLPDEDELDKTIGTMKIRAQRVRRESIWTSLNYNGAYIKLPQNVLSRANYNKDEVLQIVKVATENPLSFNYVSDFPVNTRIVEAMFMDTDSNEIAVSALHDDEKVEMYIVTDELNPGADITGPLVKSPVYEPLKDSDGVPMFIASDKVVEARIPKVENQAAGMHIQVRADFLGKSGTLQATLYKDGIPYGDLDGDDLRPKFLDDVMMSDPLHDHRAYTFFDLSGKLDTAWKVKLSSHADVNVSVMVYKSLCQFYDTSASSWSSAGCSPTSESISTVIACGCNHMTSYGGSVLISPDQIDFTDITHLDIASNPVAIITCSIILGVYIIVVVACKRMDIMDVRRISTIPLCGKDGSFKYEVTVITGRQVGAGTTANVGCRIIGEYGKSACQHLNKKGAFQRNCSDSFLVAYDVNLGEIKKVLVWHDNRGTSPSWYLDHVIVKDLQTDKKYYFFCTSWLTLEEEKGTIQKELKAAGSAEMQRFGRQMKTAAFNSLADKHLWLSILNRPAQSRFTRVQRATCCVTLLYTFIAVNAMWYGLIKKNNSASIIGDFGWEEVVVGLISNLMVFPINIGIIFLFKKSRSKSNMFDHGRKPQTAQTIEIENLCDNSQSGSFQSSAYGAVPSDLERESTLDSLPRNATATALHRSRPVKSQREITDDSLVKKPVISTTAASAKGPMWNQDSIMKWPEKIPYSEDADSRPSTSSTTMTNVRQPAGKAGITRKTSVPGTADSDELLKYLDEMESDLKETEERSVKNPGSRKPSTSTVARKQSTQTSRWGSLEDILNSDDESAITDSSKKKLKKKSSTTSQISQDKKFNPRDEPRINGNGRSLKSRESNASGSMIGGEHFYYSRGHISSEAGIAAGLKPGYQSQMTIQTPDIPILPSTQEKCTLPSWCIYIAYILCFLLCTFSVILVILYCFKFGYEESLEWVVAFIFALFQSFLLVEPVKVVLIAVYMVLVLKKVEQDEDEDCIDIEPSFDSSSEMIKDVKFKPISGFALMQAKEEGHKMHRMKVMVRQFIAYVFYLWLLMVIVYVNFRYSSYLLTRHVENNFVSSGDGNGSVSFNNISSIEDFWDWTENVFADAVHLQDSNTDEEHGFLLGVARMRLIRSTTRSCEASGSAAKLGASSLTDRTCYGTTTYEEDTASYGEGWNDSSYNLSWKHSSGGELGGGHKVGHVGTYGGGGYAHNLGTTLSQTQTLIQDLRSKDWVDLQTRAVILEFAVYSPGTDMTALMALLVEFPLTGSAIPSYEIQAQKLLWFQEGRVDPLMICEVILLLVTIYSLVHIVITIRDMRKQFFKDIWNWYEMLTTLMTVVAIGMYLGCVVEATNTFNHLLADQTGFTNFERVMYVHVGMRYLHAWLLFLLMYKVVKQLRFIKFMHIYEKTISTAVGQLLAVALIFIILLLIYAQVGYLMYGHVSGFESVGHAIVTLIVMIRGTFDFWPMLDYQPIFSHFYVYSYYAFTYGLTIALVIAILNNMYKTNRSQMFFKATLDMQDYEMVEFMMKRFKLWAGLQKEKPAFRRVKFQGLPSISSRSSSSYSHQTSSSSSHQSSSLIGPEYSRAQLDSMMSRLGPTWLACVKRFERIHDLDKEEESLVKKAESQVKELNFRLRVNNLEKEGRELLNWTKTDKPHSDQNPRQSVLRKSTTNKDTKSDKKPPASVTGVSRTSGTPPTKTEGSQIKGKRPLSDQGARNDLPAKGNASASEPKSLQKFFQQLKPSKPAWNK